MRKGPLKYLIFGDGSYYEIQMGSHVLLVFEHFNTADVAGGTSILKMEFLHSRNIYVNETSGILQLRATCLKAY